MRAFSDVFGFELRLHLKSPLFWGVALLVGTLHLLTITEVGINVSDNDQIGINSAWMIFQTELILGLFGMLPALLFPVTAITRDDERKTSELFFTTPVSRLAFLLGRFAAGTCAACAIGLIGTLGAFAGTFMPWVEPARVLAFDWRPWAATVALVVLPNVLVFSAVFFSIAAFTRSTAVTLGAAAGVLALEVFINVRTTPPVPRWLRLAEPLGALPVADAARYWTVAELNSRLPIAWLWSNRFLWMGLASAVLALTAWRYRLQMPTRPAASLVSRHVRALFDGWTSRGARRGTVRSDANAVRLQRLVSPDPPGIATSLRQLVAHLWMDTRTVWQSPLFWLMLVLTAFSVASEATSLRSELADLPLYPATSLMLDFAGPVLSQFLLLSIVYFSGVLVWREREHGVDGISSAAPYADWVLVTSKTAALGAIVLSQLAVAAAVMLTVQETAGFHDHQPAVLLAGIFLFNGVFFLMLAVVAVFVQVVSPGKWSGMVLVLLVLVAILAMPAAGFDHLLLAARFPVVAHSDMNGFGLYGQQTYALSAYRLGLCLLVVLAGHAWYLRGYRSSWRERARDARRRLTPSIRGMAGGSAALCLAAGGFIVYNTSILNRYVTADSIRAAQARYEREYGRYRDLPAPSLDAPDVSVELFAREERLESRGQAGLRNSKTAPMREFVVSVDRRNTVGELVIDGATPIAEDRDLGFYLFRAAVPLEPGSVLPMRWHLTRAHHGFTNADADTELVGNGSYLAESFVPMPGYCRDCELRADRQRFALPAAESLPALGDERHLDDLRAGTDARTTFHLILGTDADQRGVAPGEQRREWASNGRRYVEYSVARPVWPLLTIQSARYVVDRDSWRGVSLEVFHDARHGWNARTMLETAKKGLELYSHEFGPYGLPYYRIAEYARYRSNVQAGVGTIAYSEGSGFMTDLRGWTDLDYATLHELAHQWWGNVYGARMQGRQLLNEGLAQYSTLLAYRTFAPPAITRRLLAGLHNSYLDARSNETRAEQPLIQTEDQGYISYDKAPLALFALGAVIGQDAVNGALRSYFARFVDKPAPFPTSRDLVEALRQAADPEQQSLITDLFEKITLYDAGIAAASMRPVDVGYDVTIDVTARQLTASGKGEEREVPLDTWFQVAVFPESDRDIAELEPLYLELHKLHSGSQRITVRAPGRPGRVVVDPFYLMIDRNRSNNSYVLPHS